MSVMSYSTKKSRIQSFRGWVSLGFYLVVTSLLLSACAPVEAWLTIDAVEGVPPTPVIEAFSAEEVEAEVAAALVDRQLIWQGVSADGLCGELAVNTAGDGWIGACEADLTVGTPWLEIHQTEWQQIAEHFGALRYEVEDESLLLHGQGEVSDPLWGAALSEWAHFVFMETAAGRSGSAARTALAWQIPDAVGDAEADSDADSCGRLQVTRYGYAYAMLEPCAGGQGELLHEGWLTTEELAQLQEWLARLAPVSDEAGYLDGQGDQSANAMDVENMAAWSEAVFGRLQGE